MIGQVMVVGVPAADGLEAAQIAARAIFDAKATSEYRFGPLAVEENPQTRALLAQRLGYSDFYAFSALAVKP